MSQSVKMPALGESVTEGTAPRGLKAVGDTVEVDEPLLEVATDKVDTEVPSPVAGVIENILFDDDETVEVGTDLVMIGDGSGSGSEEPAAPAASAPAAQEAPAAQPAQAEQPAQPEPAQPEPQSAPAQSDAQAPAGGGDREAITMPALGESVTEGTVTRWLKE